MDTILSNAKERKSGLIVLKPGCGAAVLGNWEHLDTLFKIIILRTEGATRLTKRNRNYLILHR